MSNDNQDNHDIPVMDFSDVPDTTPQLDRHDRVAHLLLQYLMSAPDTEDSESTLTLLSDHFGEENLDVIREAFIRAGLSQRFPRITKLKSVVSFEFDVEGKNPQEAAYHARALLSEHFYLGHELFALVTDEEGRETKVKII